MLQIFQLKYSNLKLLNEIDFIGTDETCRNGNMQNSNLLQFRYFVIQKRKIHRRHDFCR